MDGQLCFLCGPKTEIGKQRLHWCAIENKGKLASYVNEIFNCSLPSADPVRERWITFIRLHLGDDWTLGEETAVKICSLHFRACDFIKGHLNHMLKSDSIPSIVIGEQVWTSLFF
jgi:THAP domain